jgi:cytochrome o ubiquinol oxidase subunit 2
MLAIVVPTIVTRIGFAWWFRASNTQARQRPDWEFSGSIEPVVRAIPLLTILLLGGVAWIGSHRFDPYQPIDGQGEPLEVQVASLDWKWLSSYPAQAAVRLPPAGHDAAPAALRRAGLASVDPGCRRWRDVDRGRHRLPGRATRGEHPSARFVARPHR